LKAFKVFSKVSNRPILQVPSQKKKAATPLFNKSLISLSHGSLPHSQPSKTTPTLIRKSNKRPSIDVDNTFIKYTRSEEEAMAELKENNRQHFLVGLDASRVNKPTILIFPDLSSTHIIFKQDITKT